MSTKVSTLTRSNYKAHASLQEFLIIFFSFYYDIFIDVAISYTAAISRIEFSRHRAYLDRKSTQLNGRIVSSSTSTASNFQTCAVKFSSVAALQVLQRKMYITVVEMLSHLLYSARAARRCRRVF